MAVILEIQNYRVGNYIDYRGGLAEFNFSKIEDIGDCIPGHIYCKNNNPKDLSFLKIIFQKKEK
jgi:hypothetical protein